MTQTIPPPRRPKPIVLLGVTCAALAIALVATVVRNWPPASVPEPLEQVTTPTPEPPQPPSAAPPGSTDAALSPKNDTGRAQIEEQLNAARITARQQIVAGQRQSALDTLVRGLAHDASDPELNGLVDELSRVGRRTATDARAAASLRGATARSSIEFRQGQAREREAESLMRAGNRVSGIRASWAAAGLYDKVPAVVTQNAAPGPSPAAPAPTAAGPMKPPAPSGQQPIPATAPPEPVKTLPTPVDKPVPPPVTPRPEPPPPPTRDPSTETRGADLAAIRETLRRYTQAYQSLDSAAVGKVMPSLSAEQLRSLGRDFSNYRSYTVEIRDERIAIEDSTATVTCQVVRSFETKNGVGGTNAVQSTFHLRRSGSGWTIERLESR